jgi:hypothetical protein
MTTNSRQGQVLVDFALAMPVLIGFAGVLAFSALGFAARTLLQLDTYMLARAHLYGNATGICRPSRFWPSSELVRVEHDCPSPTYIRSSLSFDGKVLVATEASLEGRPAW